MFTGIISAIGTIESTEQQGDLTVQISCPWSDLKTGESVAVNGVCLTIIPPPTGGREFHATLSGETLARTAPRWQKGARVNLERALKMGDALDGHMVTGHIDGIATITGINRSGDSHVLELNAPAGLAKFMAEKGSVALDGVSLTVNQVEDSRFWVNIIPHTWKATTLSERKPGDRLNLEIDLIARYVVRLMQK